MLFRPEAVNEKRRRIRGSVVLSQPLSLRLLTGTFALMTIAAAWLLFTFEFTRRESVPGYITSSLGVVSLRATNGGMLSRKFVGIGDHVEKGAPLFEATTEIESQQGPVRHAQIATTEDRLTEIREQLELVADSYVDRRSYLAQKRSGLQARRGRLREQLGLKARILEIAEDTLDRKRRLQAERHIADAEIARQLELALGHRAAIAALQSELRSTANEIDLLQLELDALPNREAKERSDLKIRQQALRESRLEQQRQSSYVVRSPVGGWVSAFQGEIGQELGRNAPVVSILPQDAKIVANLLAPSRAIGFLETGGPVNLLIDAFPYQKFGVQRGRIVEVSRSAYRPGELNVPVAYQESVYKVIVELERDFVRAYGRRHPLQVDMTLTGDLVIDRRSLLRWLLDPLIAIRR